MSTALSRWAAVAFFFGVLCISSTAGAQTFADAVKLISGAAVGLAIHESGHVAADFANGVSPGVKKVTFGPIPFFAITHDAVTPAREFVISSAGFWTQHAFSEYLLTAHADLRDEEAPILKGILAFSVLASVAYSGAAFATTGPAERDTRGMAASARVDEPVIGAMILTPAALDAARYFGAHSRWIVWASRAAKIGGALLVVRAAQQ